LPLRLATHSESAFLSFPPPLRCVTQIPFEVSDFVSPPYIFILPLRTGLSPQLTLLACAGRWRLPPPWVVDAGDSLDTCPDPAFLQIVASIFPLQWNESYRRGQNLTALDYCERLVIWKSSGPKVIFPSPPFPRSGLIKSLIFLQIFPSERSFLDSHSYTFSWFAFHRLKARITYFCPFLWHFVAHYKSSLRPFPVRRATLCFSSSPPSLCVTGWCFLSCPLSFFERDRLFPPLTV